MSSRCSIRALFYFGDGHALMGEGRAAHLETSMDAAFRFLLKQLKTIAGRGSRDAEHPMVAAARVALDARASRL